MYNILKPLLFLIDPEIAHKIGMAFVRALGFFHKLGIIKRPTWAAAPHLQTQTPFGTVDSPLGLSAGFDKNAVGLWGWQALGFGFVEVGTVTPKPQPGNEKPRLFRFSRFQALVNRLGFNNDGAKLLEATKLQVQEFQTHVSMLEIKGVIAPVGGKWFLK